MTSSKAHGRLGVSVPEYRRNPGESVPNFSRLAPVCNRGARRSAPTRGEVMEVHRISAAFLAFSLIVFPLSASSAGSAIRHYDIDAEILPGQGILRATSALRLAGTQEGLRQVRLLLNRGLAVRSVTCDGGIESYTFDRTAPSGHRYTPTAAPLIVNLSQPLTSGQSTVLRVSYEGTIEPDTWQTNFIKSDWVELALYVAWYPYDPTVRTSLFTSTVTVKIEPGYTVTGTGAEYSALMLMRDWYGDQVFTDYLEQYRKEAENKPAIWGLDRNHEAAFAVLYRKGPVLLNRLEQRIGKERFRELLGTLVAKRVSSTEQLLATIEQIASREIRQAVEQGLKQ